MPIWKRGAYWHGYARAGEKRGVPRTTGCQDKTAALAVLRDWERELADPAYAAAKGITLAHAVDRVNRDYGALVKVRKKSQATATYYVEKSGVLLDVFGTHAPLASVDAATVDAFITTRRSEGVTEHTIYKELGVLRVVLKTAKRNGWWSGDIDAVLPHNFSSGSKPRERIVTSWKALGRLLHALPSNDVAAQAAYCIAANVEAQALPRARREHISEDFVAVKGKKRPTRDRLVPIVTPWQRLLLLFVDRFAEGEDGLLFRCTEWGLRNGLRKTCAALGLPHLSPNDLRRTFNVWMQRDGVPTELRAPAMGHASTRLLDSFTYGKLAPADLRDRMLNTLADRRNGVGDVGGFKDTQAHVVLAAESGMAPRAGIEPATHGLTVRVTHGLYRRGTLRVMRSIVNVVSLP